MAMNNREPNPLALRKVLRRENAIDIEPSTLQNCTDRCIIGTSNGITLFDPEDSYARGTLRKRLADYTVNEGWTFTFVDGQELKLIVYGKETEVVGSSYITAREKGLLPGWICLAFNDGEKGKRQFIGIPSHQVKVVISWWTDEGVIFRQPFDMHPFSDR